MATLERDRANSVTIWTWLKCTENHWRAAEKWNKRKPPLDWLHLRAYGRKNYHSVKVLLLTARTSVPAQPFCGKWYIVLLPRTGQILQTNGRIGIFSRNFSSEYGIVCLKLKCYALQHNHMTHTHARMFIYRHLRTLCVYTPTYGHTQNKLLTDWLEASPYIQFAEYTAIWTWPLLWAEIAPIRAILDQAQYNNYYDHAMSRL